MTWMFPDAADQKRALELYGGADMPNEEARLSRFTRDWMFACPTRDIATAASKAGVPVYQYVFSFNETGFLERTLGTSHGFELPFVWKTDVKTLGIAQGQLRTFQTMADTMTCTWASFVTCQKPRCAKNPPHCDDVINSLPEWPLFDSHRNYLSLKVIPTVEQIKAEAPFGEDEMPGDDKCDFLKEAIQRSGFRHLANHPKIRT